ncbi:MAG TPA: Gfo/Idh/MocA family oxidoreductase [Chthonomonadales bacterium]|nr:Gfo/Idh/MocA family oxidoreductase [Chthonomonadales bacterium]
MSYRLGRREFLKSAAAVGLSAWAIEEARAQAKSPNERVNFACIGVGGKGESDSEDAARLGNVVAICDVDDNTLNAAAQKYPGARKFNDFRVMFDQMSKSIDAVTVSIPDHNHAVAAAMAMHLHKACFCQKPLAHSLFEIRSLSELARRNKVATQMGNQGTAESGLRRGAALVKAGAIGVVREVHVWTNRPIWPQGGGRPATKPVPPYLHWDIWLGPAPERPFGEDSTTHYHPFAWRGFWDFGTGALGDMACHTMNLPYMALDLRDPIAVQAQTSGNNKEQYPVWSIIKYEFPATSSRPAVTMTWYDGGKKPPQDLLTEPFEDSGSLMIGDKGKLYAPGDYGENGKVIGGVDVGEPKYVESPGHFDEFVRAIKTGEPAMSNFPNYSGPLAETVVLGNLAVWADGKRVEWDSRHLRAKNAPDVSRIIHPRFRAGYRL